MDVSEAINTRKTIRRFGSRPVDDEQIRQILEAGRRAPSGSNTQPWRFVVVRDDARKARLADASGGQKAVSTASVVIVVCADRNAMHGYARNRRWAEFRLAGMDEELATTGVIEAVKRIYDKETEQTRQNQLDAVSLASNTAIAVSFMLLRAQELGIGSCWLGAFSRSEAREIACVPDSLDVLWLLALGYPDITPVERPRKPLDEIVRYETWETG